MIVDQTERKFDNPKSKEVFDDLMKVLDKHDIGDFLIVFRMPLIKKEKVHRIRVISSTGQPDNQEHTIAVLIEKALEISPKLRSIFEHMSKHALAKVVSEMKLQEKGKKAD